MLNKSKLLDSYSSGNKVVKSLSVGQEFTMIEIQVKSISTVASNRIKKLKHGYNPYTTAQVSP